MVEYKCPKCGKSDVDYGRFKTDQTVFKNVYYESVKKESNLPIPIYASLCKNCGYVELFSRAEDRRGIFK